MQRWPSISGNESSLSLAPKQRRRSVRQLQRASASGSGSAWPSAPAQTQQQQQDLEKQPKCNFDDEEAPSERSTTNLSDVVGASPRRQTQRGASDVARGDNPQSTMTITGSSSRHALLGQHVLAAAPQQKGCMDAACVHDHHHRAFSYKGRVRLRGVRANAR